MTEVEIIEWTSEAGRRIAAGEVELAPLTAKQRARIEAARGVADEAGCQPARKRA